eukprot:Pgem_evm1s14630
MGQGFKENGAEVNANLIDKNYFLCYSEGHDSGSEPSLNSQVISQFRAHWLFLMNDVRPKMMMLDGDFTKDGAFVSKGKKKILE